MDESFHAGTGPLDPDWLTADLALARLGVARQTLYAYVSRGLVKTRPAPDDPRRSLYNRHGIDALLARRRRGRARRAVAASTIDFGEPVLTSGITQIADGRLWYRGQDAIRLAGSEPLERVAALLWGSDALPALPPSTYVPIKGGPAIARCLRHVADLPEHATNGAGSPLQEAAWALRAVAEAVCNARIDGPVHEALATAWRVGPNGADLLRRALVLCADHELNASAFAVRVVASTGATLPCCLLAGMAALSGPLHGGVSERLAALVAEPGMLTDPRSAIAARVVGGAPVPGFGQLLYPDGDPRAADLFTAIGPAPAWRAFIAAVVEATGLRPNIDAALLTLERHLDLPCGSALAIFAVGRTTGWIAHALEQRREGHLIRPRAVYAGPPAAA